MAKKKAKTKPKARPKTKAKAKSKPKAKPKAKPSARAKAKPKVGPAYPAVDICNGGQLSSNSLYIQFANGTGSPCLITSVQGNLFPVPQPIAPGMNTVGLNGPAPTGNYSFHSTCVCSQGGDPVIKVQ